MKNSKNIIILDPISEMLESLQLTPTSFDSIEANNGYKCNVTTSMFYKFAIITNGNFIFDDTFNCISYTKYDLIIIPENRIYTFKCIEDHSSLLFLDFDLKQKEINYKFNSVINLLEITHYKNLVDDRQINNLVHLKNSVSINNQGSYILLKSMIHRLMLVIIKQNVNSNKYNIVDKKNDKEKILYHCIEYIKNHINCKITIKTMSLELNYCENYLYKLFMEYLNISCKDYILKSKLEKACYLLSSTNNSLTSIAVETGYANIHYFSTSFKKHYLISPFQYRKDNKN